MTIEQEREKLKETLQASKFNTAAIFAHESEAPPLDMKILHKRRVNTDYYKYEEWKIEYTVETQESTPLSAAQRVSAYLLVPWHEKPPVSFPAMISFHQCNVDCPLGKEAVVGKVAYRPDQAYGLELVNEGFVVLAPDSINCGERFIPSIRKEGEGKQCVNIIEDALGRHQWHKHHLDNIRAVNLLCSLDFVDSERIGAIGHSMGNIDARDLMTYDARVKACIISGGLQPDTFIPLHSPRLHMALMGAFDGSQSTREEVKLAYENAKRFYEADGAAENLILSIHDCGHHFLDAFKWKAYAKLRQYFEMDEDRKSVSLTHIVTTARNHHALGRGNQIPELTVPEQVNVTAEEKRLITAFGSLFTYLSAKRRNTPLAVEIQEDQNTLSVIYSIQSDNPQNVATTQMHFGNYLRHAYQLFAGAGASLQENISPDALEYIVMLPKTE